MAEVLEEMFQKPTEEDKEQIAQKEAREQEEQNV